MGRELTWASIILISLLLEAVIKLRTYKVLYLSKQLMTPVLFKASADWTFCVSLLLTVLCKVISHIHICERLLLTVLFKAPADGLICVRQRLTVLLCNATAD